MATSNQTGYHLLEHLLGDLKIEPCAPTLFRNEKCSMHDRLTSVPHMTKCVPYMTEFVPYMTTDFNKSVSYMTTSVYARSIHEATWSSEGVPKTTEALAPVYVWQRRVASGKIYPFPTPVFDGDQF